MKPHRPEMEFEMKVKKSIFLSLFVNNSICMRSFIISEEKNCGVIFALFVNFEVERGRNGSQKRKKVFF
jgi:hypothetical protein